MSCSDVAEVVLRGDVEEMLLRGWCCGDDVVGMVLKGKVSLFMDFVG